MENEIKMAQNNARRAIKIALVACAITLLFAVLSMWVLLNQITATAVLTKTQKAQELQLKKLESELLRE